MPELDGFQRCGTVGGVHPLFLDTANDETLSAIAALPPVALDSPASAGWLAAGDDAARLVRWQQSAGELARCGVRPAPSHFLRVDGTAVVGFDSFFNPEDLFPDRDLATEPIVVLAYRFGRTGTVPSFASGLPWVAISPQTAGYACHHPRVVALVVDLSPEGVERSRILAGYADSFDDGHRCVGLGVVEERERDAYHAMVTRLGLSADHVSDFLEEGFSPLDATVENLAAFGVLPIGADLHRVMTLTGSPATTQGRWCLAVLGENCD